MPNGPARCNARLGKFGGDKKRCIKPAVEGHSGRCSDQHHRCRFKTAAGNPCKNPQKEGKDNCRLHDGLPDPDALADSFGHISIEVKKVVKPNGEKKLEKNIRIHH